MTGGGAAVGGAWSYIPEEWWPESLSELAELELDRRSLLWAGGRLQRINMWPWFDICHYLITIGSLRDDMGPDGMAFARKHPLSTWLSSMLMSFAGGFLSSFLLGEPIITPFKSNFDVAFGTVMWYLVFFSPFDIVYKVCKIKPIKIGIAIMKEVQRAFKVHHGVLAAVKAYPESYVVQVMVGASKGAGGGIVKMVEQLVRGVWTPHKHEIISPSFTSKACVVAALVFAVERNSMWVSMPHDLVYLGIVTFFVYFKLSGLLFGVKDPMAPFENIFCSVFLGGIMDAFSRAVNETKKEATAGKKKTTEEDVLNEKKYKSQGERKKKQ